MTDKHSGKRLTLRLPEDLYQRLAGAAQSKKLPVTWIIIDLLDTAFGLPTRQMRAPHYAYRHHYDDKIWWEKKS